STPPTGSPSASAAPIAPSPAGCAAASSEETAAAAASPAANAASDRSTTSPGGATRAPRTPTTSSGWGCRMNPDYPARVSWRRAPCGMAVNVRECDREQLYLMPPSVLEWLPEDHLVFFVLDVVAELDMGAFY